MKKDFKVRDSYKKDGEIQLILEDTRSGRLHTVSQKEWNRSDDTRYMVITPYKGNVDHPSHYTQGGIECIEAIKASMTREAYKGYLKGNTLKYLWRFEKKNNPLEDLQKARVYLNWLIEAVEDDADRVNQEIRERIERS